jgi:pteridine reductase
MAASAGERPVALITGAARRVGATIARRLHAAGFDVALHRRHSRAELDALIAELEQARTSSTLALEGDLGDVAALVPLVEKTIDRFGRLDALVNNASAFYPTPIADATPAQWDDLFAANARAPFFLAQAAAPHLAKRSGAIVNLVDIYADAPLADHPIYVMTKAALAAMTKALARDLAPAVRVNGVSPGAVLWPESGKDSVARQSIVERTPLQRVGAPDDIAGAVLFLLEARFVTGEIVRVDGGRHLVI